MPTTFQRFYVLKKEIVVNSFESIKLFILVVELGKEIYFIKWISESRTPRQRLQTFIGH